MCSHSDLLGIKCLACISVDQSEQQAMQLAASGAMLQAAMIRQHVAQLRAIEAAWEQRKMAQVLHPMNSPLARRILVNNSMSLANNINPANNPFITPPAQRGAQRAADELRRVEEQRRFDESIKRDMEETFWRTMADRERHHNMLMGRQMKNQRDMARLDAAAAAGRAASHRGGGGGGRGSSSMADGFLWDPPVYGSGGSMADGFRW